MADFLTNRFKQALAERKQFLGGWSMSGSPVMVEALSHVAYDYLVIDIEHSVVPPPACGGFAARRRCRRCGPNRAHGRP